MRLSEIIESVPLKVEVDSDLEREVTGGYIGDLLSQVMAQAKNGNIWITIQGHQNIIAVAALLNLSGIIIASGVAPAQNMLEKAREEGINIFTSKANSYQLACQLHSAGVK